MDTLVYASKNVPLPLYFRDNRKLDGITYKINLEFE